MYIKYPAGTPHVALVQLEQVEFLQIEGQSAVLRKARTPRYCRGLNN